MGVTGNPLVQRALRNEGDTLFPEIMLKYSDFAIVRHFTFD